MTVADWWGDELIGRPGAELPWARGAGTVTFGRLRTEVDRLHRILRRHGVRAGGTVLVHGVPSFTQVWSVLALWSLGAQVVLVPQHVPGGIGATAAVARPQFRVTLGGLAGSGGRFRDECEVLVSRCPGGEPATTGHCLVVATAGRTGPSRLVGRSPESLFAEVVRLGALPGMARRSDDVLLLAPCDRSFGLVAGVLAGTAAGARLHVPGPARTEAAAREADVVVGTPAGYARLTATAAPGSSRIRRAVSGGGPLPAGVRARFAGTHGVRIGQVYGTAEAGTIAADPLGLREPSCVGAPLPGVRTRIRDGTLEVHLAQTSDPRARQPGNGGWASTRDRAAWDPVDGTLRLRDAGDEALPEHRSPARPAPGGQRSDEEFAWSCSVTTSPSSHAHACRPDGAWAPGTSSGTPVR